MNLEDLIETSNPPVVYPTLDIVPPITRAIRKVPGTHEGDTFCRQQIGIEPQLAGFRVLVRAPFTLHTTEGGTDLPDEHRAAQNKIDPLGLVLAMGPLVFTGPLFKDDPKPRASIGDWVHFAWMEKREFYIGDVLCYYFDDDKIESRILPEDVPFLLGQYRI